MKLLDFTLSLLLLTFSTVVIAQSKASTKATKLYKGKQYAEAIPFFEEAVAETPNYSLKSRLAFCYKVTNQLEKAESLYSGLVYDDKVKPISFRRYAETLMSSGKYAAAKFWLDEYIKKKPEDEQAKVLLQSCELVYTIKPYFENSDVTPFEFNSDFDDNAPTIVNGKLYYTSDGSGTGKSNAEGRNLMNVFSSELLEGVWAEPTKLSGKINTVNNNSGPISFTSDGSTAIFCKNAPVPNKAGQLPLQIFIADVEDGKVKPGGRVSSCKIDINYFQAAISPDGNTIIFSADRGGDNIGKADLYMTTKKGEKWSPAKNLGAVINTAESEGFPFLTNNKLYFCTKGRLGFGGFDLYVSEKNSSGLWTEPVNLGFPINSSGDDMSIYVDESTNTGVVSSTRKSGSDDLFFFGPKEDEVAVVDEVTEEDSTPDFAKAAIAKQEQEKERLKLEKIAKAKAAEEAESLRLKEEAEAIAKAARDREESVRKDREALAQVETEYDIDTPELQEEEAVTINELSDKAIDTKGGDTLYVGKRIEEPVVASTNVNVPKQEKDKIKSKVNKTAKTVSTETTAIETPTVKSPVVETPEIKRPVAEESVIEKPSDEIVSTEISAVETPAVQKPIVETKVVDDPAVKTPVVETPAVADVQEVEMPQNEKEVIKEVEKTVSEKIAEAPKPISNGEVTSKATKAVSMLASDIKSSSPSSNAYTLEDLKYKFNATEVTSDLEGPLNELANILKAESGLKIKMIGHTGSIGSDEKNQRLSVARAAAAVDYLITKGVDPLRLTFEGKGESEILNGCHDGVLCGRDQHAENDRIEMLVQ